MKCKMLQRNFKSPFITAFSKFSHDDVFIPYPAEFEVLYDDTVSCAVGTQKQI